jgi:nucleoside-diphosphate-sugar epimerase
MQQSSFLVTGAHGFIGAWVVKRLLAEDAQVVIFDRSADPHRLRMIMDEDELSRPIFIEGDIVDEASLPPVIEEHGITHVIHLAGLQVPICRADPRRGALVNVIGTINVFEAALRSKGQIKSISYASSAAVFGDVGEDRPAREEEATNPSTHYGAFKRCNEDNARVYFLDHGISSVGLRPLTVYGVGRDFGVTSDPTKAMKAAVVGRPFHIRFGGRTDFLYAADAADGFIRAATQEYTGARVFNLHGETAAISDVVAEIERVRPEARGSITWDETPMKIPPELDATALRAFLGEMPETTVANGVRATIERFDRLNSEGRLSTSDLDG